MTVGWVTALKWFQEECHFYTEKNLLDRESSEFSEWTESSFSSTDLSNSQTYPSFVFSAFWMFTTFAFTMECLNIFPNFWYPIINRYNRLDLTRVPFFRWITPGYDGGYWERYSVMILHVRRSWWPHSTNSPSAGRGTIKMLSEFFVSYRITKFPFRHC